MKIWPVPDSCYKKLPKIGTPGSFWEDRKDRYHCGIDIYHPEGSKILSVEDGKVIEIGLFTSPKILPYWNLTYYVLIKNKSGLICKYAEMGDVKVKKNKLVKAGQLIGHIGLVLNSKNIEKIAPLYIQNINENENNSMLHFELYNKKPNLSKKYLGENWFGRKKPTNLLDPTDYLISFS